MRRKFGAVLAVVALCGFSACATNDSVTRAEQRLGQRIDALESRVGSAEQQAKDAAARADQAAKQAEAAAERADRAARTSEAIFNKSVRK